MAKDKVVYQEFSSNGNGSKSTERPPNSGESNLERSPISQNLKIQLSRKGRNGKTVTVIMGFQLDQTALNLLLKQLKNQCGTGGSLNQEAETSQLEIQGDHRTKILEILTKLGYKAKII
jgi:translation initiation factor 1